MLCKTSEKMRSYLFDMPNLLWNAFGSIAFPLTLAWRCCKNFGFRFIHFAKSLTDIATAAVRYPILGCTFSLPAGVDGKITKQKLIHV
jgi:hypothetical protein